MHAPFQSIFRWRRWLIKCLQFRTGPECIDLSVIIHHPMIHKIINHKIKTSWLALQCITTSPARSHPPATCYCADNKSYKCRRVCWCLPCHSLGCCSQGPIASWNRPYNSDNYFIAYGTYPFTFVLSTGDLACTAILRVALSEYLIKPGNLSVLICLKKPGCIDCGLVF